MQAAFTRRDIEQQCLIIVYRIYTGHATRLFSDEELIAIAVADDGTHKAAQQVVEQIHQLNALNSFLNVCSDEALSSGSSTTPKPRAMLRARYKAARSPNLPCKP